MKKPLIIIALILASVSAFAAGEGIVTVYMPSPAGLANKLAADFEAKTGIEVRTFQGTTGEILARLETEKANPVADVVILASWSDGLSMKESGQLEPYTPANADKMVPGWIDEDSTLFGYSASAVGVIYNTLIYPELDADWDGLADRKLLIPRPWRGIYEKIVQLTPVHVGQELPYRAVLQGAAPDDRRVRILKGERQERSECLSPVLTTMPIRQWLQASR